jgi:CMP-N-acetylneuraminic acid synthetase
MIAGIIVVKENSNRFPNKNICNYKDKPLFWHNVEVMQNCEYEIDVYVATNSKFVKDYCINNGVKVIDRGINISDDEQSLFEVIKYTYQSLDEKYPVIVSILANSINNDSKQLESAIDLLINNELREVRSYDKNGVENGILVFDNIILETKHEISAYVGAITTDAKEIHYKEDLDEN